MASCGCPENRVGKASERFSLVLEKTKGPKDGPPSHLTCTYSYDWDFGTNEGLAHLEAVDGVTASPLPITCNAAGIQNTLAWIGAQPDKPVKLDHYELICYNVWLVIKDGCRSASILAGADREILYETANEIPDQVRDVLAQKK